MSQLITGLFTDHPAGHAAADALKKAGFRNDSVRLITAAGAAKAATPPRTVSRRPSRTRAFPKAMRRDVPTP
jgi:hypothetical protein